MCMCVCFSENSNLDIQEWDRTSNEMVPVMEWEQVPGIRFAAVTVWASDMFLFNGIWLQKCPRSSSVAMDTPLEMEVSNGF